jgi:hypothetical protein
LQPSIAAFGRHASGFAERLAEQHLTHYLNMVKKHIGERSDPSENGFQRVSVCEIDVVSP